MYGAVKEKATTDENKHTGKPTMSVPRFPQELRSTKHKTTKKDRLHPQNLLVNHHH
jgi:hypothetical protein